MAGSFPVCPESAAGRKCISPKWSTSSGSKDGNSFPSAFSILSVISLLNLSTSSFEPETTSPIFNSPYLVPNFTSSKAYSILSSSLNRSIISFQILGYLLAINLLACNGVSNSGSFIWSKMAILKTFIASVEESFD